MNDVLLLGIDIGTTATKATLFTPEGLVVSEGRATYSTQHPQPGWVEQDPEQWWRAVCDATKIAMGEISSVRVAGVAVSAQAPTLIAVDKNGKSLRPAMVWMDRRADAEVEELLRKVPTIANISGNRADPFYVAAKISWFRKNEPKLFALTRYFLQITGYINFRLTGEFGLDPAHATLLQLRDYKKGTWSQELLSAVGVDADYFPEIRESAALQGEVTAAASSATGLQKGTLVFTGTVDGAAAALEAGVIDPGIAAEMTGTSTVLLMPTDGAIVEPAFIAMAHAIPDRQLLLGAMVSSGASVQWLHEKMFAGNSSIAELMASATEVDPGSGGVIFLPYMMGERAPIWHTNARGVFFGLSLTTSQPATVRAVLEGTAFAMAHNLEVARKAGVVINEIRSIGGGTKNSLWSQIKADVLGIPVVVPKASTGATFGDALVAGIGLGLYPDIRATLLDVVKIQSTYQPDPARHAYYQVRYRRYRDLYENIKDDFDKSAESAIFGGNR